MSDLESIVDRLIRNEVEFVLIGGFAAMAHGASLMTHDVDICMRFDFRNIGRLLEAVRDLDPVHRMPARRVPLTDSLDELSDFKNLYLDTNLGQLDCVSRVDGLGDYDAIVTRSIRIDLSSGPCRLLDLDALIESKRTMNRPRDREAVLMLEAIRESLREEE